MVSILFPIIHRNFIQLSLIELSEKRRLSIYDNNNDNDNDEDDDKDDNVSNNYNN